MYKEYVKYVNIFSNVFVILGERSRLDQFSQNIKVTVLSTKISAVLIVGPAVRLNSDPTEKIKMLVKNLANKSQAIEGVLLQEGKKYHVLDLEWKNDTVGPKKAKNIRI